MRCQSVSSIGIKRNDSSGRRHFTMWHERYHYLVNEDRWHFQCRDWHHRLQERQCNIFADHVLMPQEWVVEMDGPLWLAARELWVSARVLSVRLDQLGLRGEK